MPRAAVYCRVSTKKQEKSGYSLTEQLRILPERAKAEGFTVDPDDIYTETESGAKDNRPQYNKLMGLITEGYYDAVFVVETSRLSRTESMAEEERIIKTLAACNCVLRTLGSSFNFNSLDDEFSYGIHSVVNRTERKRIRLRSLAGKNSKREKGGYVGANPPTGYKKARDPETGKVRFSLDNDAIKPVKIAFKMALKGDGGTKIVTYLRTHGYRNGAGNPYELCNVYDWLRNPLYAGYNHVGMRRGTKAKETGIFPANFLDKTILTFEEWQRVQAILDSRRHGTPHANFPLSGILRCPNCSRRMIGTYKGNPQTRQNYYACIPAPSWEPCTGDKAKSIKMDVAHQMLIDILPDLVDRADLRFGRSHAALIEQTDTGEPAIVLEGLQARARDIEKRIRRQLLDQEESYSPMRRQRIQELEQELEAVRREIRQGQQQALLPATLDLVGVQELIPDLSPDDHEELGLLARQLLTMIYFERTGTHRRHQYRFTECVTTWSETVRLGC